MLNLASEQTAFVKHKIWELTVT